MIAKCTHTEEDIDLTIGKEYEIKEFDNFHGMVRLVGDEGKLFWYAPRFVEVWE